MWRASRARQLTARFSSPLGAYGLIAALGSLVWLDLLPCPFAALTSLPCPGCGLSRAARQLLAGELDAALALHPLSPLVVPVVVAGVLWVERGERRGALLHPAPGCVRARRAADVAAVLLAAALLAVWIARFWGAFGGPAPV